MIRLLACLLSGVVFAIGLHLAGMTSTANVRGFLDVFGAWNPRLAFVMASALAVVIPGERWLTRQKKPLLAPNFDSVADTGINATLLIGAALFGIGWGLVGLCPGPLVVVLGSLHSEPWLFAAATIAGMASASLVRRFSAK